MIRQRSTRGESCNRPPDYVCVAPFVGLHHADARPLFSTHKKRPDECTSDHGLTIGRWIRWRPATELSGLLARRLDRRPDDSQGLDPTQVRGASPSSRERVLKEVQWRHTLGPGTGGGRGTCQAVTAVFRAHRPAGALRVSSTRLTSWRASIGIGGRHSPRPEARLADILTRRRQCIALG